MMNVILTDDSKLNRIDEKAFRRSGLKKITILSQLKFISIDVFSDYIILRRRKSVTWFSSIYKLVIVYI